LGSIPRLNSHGNLTAPRGRNSQVNGGGLASLSSTVVNDVPEVDLHDRGDVRSVPQRRNGGGRHLGIISPKRGNRWWCENSAVVLRRVRVDDVESKSFPRAQRCSWAFAREEIAGEEGYPRRAVSAESRERWQSLSVRTKGHQGGGVQTSSRGLLL
jgi:hypothetical protein